MAKDLICFRLPPEVRAQVEDLVAQQGITLSEWYRAITMAALGQTLGVSEGYLQGRALGFQVAKWAIDHAGQLVPSSYEEALARFGTMSTTDGA